MIERWIAIKGYEGLYEISNLGNVRSLQYGKVRVLKPGINKGYLIADLCKDGKRKKFLVHRLVYEAFIGAIPKGMIVDHVNGRRNDNRLSNLQLLTQADNLRKACNKQLNLIEAQYPHRELTFKSSVIASEFFSYKKKEIVATIISRARKRGENWINLRGTKYFFAQGA